MTARQRILPVLAIALLVAVFMPAAGRAAEPAPETVDLLFLYSAGVTARYGSGVETRINHLVNVSNDIFRRSEAGLRLRSVHSAEVNTSDTANSRTALDAVTDNTGPFAGVEALRDRVGADLVVLLRPYTGDGICGIAWIGGYKTNGDFSHPIWKRYGYSHVSVDCSDYVLSHELGHNMGLRHSRKQDVRGGTFPYALGHGVNRSFVTVMAYGSAFQAPKVHLFSHPALSCNGQPCGVPASNTANGADAAHTLQRVASQIAGYSPEATAPPASGHLQLLAPNSSSLLTPKLSYALSWEKSADIDKVDLSYRATGATSWVPLATGVSGSTLVWPVPGSLAGSSLYILLDGFGVAGNPVVSDLSDEIAVKKIVKKKKKKRKRKKWKKKKRKRKRKKKKRRKKHR